MKLIQYLSENLYISIVIAVVIALIVFFIIGSIKEKQNEKLLKEKLKENEIKAPYSNKRFVQGEVIERQHFKNEHEETDKGGM